MNKKRTINHKTAEIDALCFIGFCFESSYFKETLQFTEEKLLSDTSRRRQRAILAIAKEEIVGDFMEKEKILKKKAFLYVTEFFAGMSVMAVELGASRLLAPYFSSSQIVWTIIIGTIMIAMALGNVYGGRSADQKPDPDKLSARILLAGIWIALIPVIGKYVILAVSALLIFTVSSGFLMIAAFATCMIIFVFPLFLLGTVTPSLAKYSTDSLEENGKVVGALGAYNTIGSIIGTFVPTFVTIPAVGTSITFLLFAGILLVLAAIYFISVRRSLRKVAVGAVVFLLCCALGYSDSFAFWEPNLVYEGESVYNYLQVKEDERQVILSTNVLIGIQSVYMKEDELTGLYYDYALAGPLMVAGKQPEDLKVLILGMGTGTYALQCRHFYPEITVKGVEIDDKITELARRYFALPEDIEVTTYDGRAYLNADSERYDLILVDAYQDITIPFQMSSREFFSLVKEHLNENGVMVVNMNMRGTEEGNINQYLADTIAACFRSVKVVDVPGITNRVLFVSENPALLQELTAKTKTLEHPKLKALMEKVADSCTDYSAGKYLLTDDQAPVELLGMKVIDRLIQEEAAYYKGIYQEKGIKGVLEAF